MPYTGGNSSLAPKNWTGTSRQAWQGEHVIVQYYNRLSGSSDYIQHGDLEKDVTPRRLPHLFTHGPFNQYGYDAGVANDFKLDATDGLWKYHFMTEWPAIAQINQWGMNPDGLPDSTGVFGDVDGDGVLDRMPPSSLADSVINVTVAPPQPYLGWMLVVNDANYKFEVVPTGNQSIQIAIFVLSWIVPIVTAALSVWAYLGAFYTVKFNQVGVSEKKHIIPMAVKKLWMKGEKDGQPPLMSDAGMNVTNVALAQDAGGARRTVLIATMEYDIEDWNIKIKIGGLGVMAQLMGKSLGHQDLIWVVPCVGGIEYPTDEPAEPMYITILESIYEVQVQYHRLRNITYVLLDAPIFRKQSKSDPYPARMDDLESAVYYSSWNQCIALTMSRFNIDLYHINDYHGAIAPLYLLPEHTIPCALSLHNAEFQGLWPLRTVKEFDEVCSVFNLDSEIVKKYIQFGDVFNLLHAGASYLRIHQKGFGAVGVSKKYGARSHARYPIFWGLDKVGHLPNPDPTDVAEWSGSQEKGEVVIDEAFEASRPELKRQAQEWAGLIQDPEADLLVFVGRWSMQKGIDLIADVMPAVLEENPKVQVMTIGPVIDLYGKFAALKLDVMMKKYPGRVYSKPEFTALPPFVFSGAEFALIPSRDEPFGLVAVEFGRKGALGIGARVGGLGQMPGWWFTVESTTTSHMLHQFKVAIKDALASKPEVRRVMRAKSAKQRVSTLQIHFWAYTMLICTSSPSPHG
jgi:alpha-1,3-glucan synthase